MIHKRSMNKISSKFSYALKQLSIEQRESWEAPFIQPHKIGGMNKHGQGTARNKISKEVFGHSVEELVSKFGSPLFVSSEEKLRSNIRKLKRAFQRRYCNVVHAWSYKTNYTSAICQIVHQEGSWAEVVSEFEYEKARSLGIEGTNIIFNGPNKSKRILEKAMAENAHIHIDHMDELKLVESIARENNYKSFPLTLRINFNTGYTEPWTRFGFNLESQQVQQTASYIKASPWLKLVGLHSHIGTYITEAKAYAEQVRIMCKLMQELELDGHEIDYIDIGGGFPSRNALISTYLPPDQSIQDLHDYVEAITDALILGTEYRHNIGRSLPQLIFESGRAIVDDTQVLIASVVGNKRLPDGKRASILNAGVNLLFTAYWYKHDIHLTRENTGIEEETVLYGPLCMNIDVIRHSIKLPPLKVGDHLTISHVGAYNNTQWQQFIEYRPNIVLVHTDGQVSIIRKSETLESMNTHDVLPKHLTNIEI